MSNFPLEPTPLWQILSGLMNKHYLHISFHYPSSMSVIEAAHWIQPVINTADDWLKYADNCWIIWTNGTPDSWYQKLAAIEALKSCSVLIVKLNLTPENRAGQLPKWIWDWIQKTRT